MFRSGTGEKNVLSNKTMIFTDICSKIAFLAPKWAKMVLGPHWEPTRLQYWFLTARIWKPYARKKNFRFISHRKKICTTKPGILRPYWILRNISKPPPEQKTTPRPFSKGHLELPKSTIKILWTPNYTGHLNWPQLKNSVLI